MICRNFIDGEHTGKNAVERYTNECIGELKPIKSAKETSKGLIKRRYQCKHCGKRVSTYEIRSEDVLRLSMILDQVQHVKDSLFPKTLTSSIRTQIRNEEILKLSQEKLVSSQL